MEIFYNQEIHYFGCRHDAFSNKGPNFSQPMFLLGLFRIHVSVSLLKWHFYGLQSGLSKGCKSRVMWLGKQSKLFANVSLEPQLKVWHNGRT